MPPVNHTSLDVGCQGQDLLLVLLLAIEGDLNGWGKMNVPHASGTEINPIVLSGVSHIEAGGRHMHDVILPVVVTAEHALRF